MSLSYVLDHVGTRASLSDDRRGVQGGLRQLRGEGVQLGRLGALLRLTDRQNRRRETHGQDAPRRVVAQHAQDGRRRTHPARVHPTVPRHQSQTRRTVYPRGRHHGNPTSDGQSVCYTRNICLLFNFRFFFAILYFINAVICY